LAALNLPSKFALAFICGLTVLMAGCATAPYTGRRQLMISSEERETSMGLQAFRYLKQRYPVCRDPAVTETVQRVGGRIAAAANRPDYRWEFVVFENKEANAFCLPGGKVGIFTGILKYTRDEAGLATVMAHEAAHALARHAGERMSQSTLAQVGGLGLGLGLGGVNPVAGQAIMQGYGLGAQMGFLLPYSRAQEYEADRIGMILLAKAGYDPAAALDFWKRMQAKERGPNLPQFLSSHPKDENRIREMTAFLPEAQKYYQPPAQAYQPYAPPAPWPPREPQPQDDLDLQPLATGGAIPAATPQRQPPPGGRWMPPSR
jgi:predicted Zn-dependent protease